MEYIFVYGQFRDSGRKLLGTDAVFCGRAWISGKLYKVDDFYPGWIPASSGKVWGEVYLFNPENLPQMDEYEGHEYTRVKVRCSTDIECQVYMWNRPVDGFREIKSGDWQLR